MAEPETTSRRPPEAAVCVMGRERFPFCGFTSTAPKAICLSFLKSKTCQKIHEMWTFAWLSLFLDICGYVWHWYPSSPDAISACETLHILGSCGKVLNYCTPNFKWRDNTIVTAPCNPLGANHETTISRALKLASLLVRTYLVFDSACAELAGAILFGHFGIPASEVWIFSVGFQSLRHSFSNLAQVDTMFFLIQL